MSTQIGFTPPEPPRKWKFDLGAQAGMIEETITGNKIYLYDWVADGGNVKFGILQSDTRHSNETVEAKALRRAAGPGIGLIR